MRARWNWVILEAAVFATVLLSMIVVASYALAADGKANTLDLDNKEIAEKTGRALMILFAIAILIENALAVIFNWRVFLTFFNARGLKTLIMIGVSYAAVSTFEADVVASILSAYMKNPIATGWFSVLLTTLILAGGSSGVNNLMVALKFRDPKKAEAKVPKPAPNKAWIAIRVTRDEVLTGPINVRIGEATAPVANPPAALAGTINDVSLGVRIKEQFIRDKTRFPQNGGHVVDPGKVYDIQIDGLDGAGNVKTAAINGQYVFAPGAIVDLETTL